MFELVKNNILPQSNLLKYVMLAAISFISGSLLFWLIVSSSHATKEQIKMNTASSFVNMKTQDLHDISKSILSFKKTFGMDLNFKKNRTHRKEKIDDNLSQIVIDKKDLLRVILSFTFTLMDINKDKLVDKAEWMMFFSNVDSQFNSNYTNTFNEINGGQSFNLPTFLESVNKIFGFVNLFIRNLTRKGELQVAEMIINDKSSYKNFQNILFSITDRDHDNFITKNEIISLLVTLGLSAKKAETYAQQYLDYFSYIPQRIDIQTISRDEFNNLFAILRKPLQGGLKTEKAILRVHQMETELVQKQKQIEILTFLRNAQDDDKWTNNEDPTVDGKLSVDETPSDDEIPSSEETPSGDSESEEDVPPPPPQSKRRSPKH